MIEHQYRKKNRLENYDYSSNGLYFVTICVTDKRCLLGKVVGGDAFITPKVELSLIGITVLKYIKGIKGIEKYTIMPNHIHMIISIENSIENDKSNQSLSQLIKSFKILVTKEIGFSIFQRSFYDRIIRCEKEYCKICSYIDTNKIKWKEDCYYIDL